MDFCILKKFADTHRLNISKDDCGDLVVQGRHGQVYEYDISRLAVIFMPGEHKPRLWGLHRCAAQAIGMILIQNGDGEGTLAFDPQKFEQGKMAIRIARIRRKRKLSGERILELRGYLEQARKSRSRRSEEGHFGV